MFAIVQACGRQYRAEPGSTVKLERLSGAVGEEVTLDQVLLFAEDDEIRIGQPLVDGVAVKGRIVEQGREQKIVVFKHKRRKDYRKKQGHRQSYTAVFVEGIEK